jgi:cell division protein FtsL
MTAQEFFYTLLLMPAAFIAVVLLLAVMWCAFAVVFMAIYFTFRLAVKLFS